LPQLENKSVGAFPPTTTELCNVYQYGKRPPFYFPTEAKNFLPKINFLLFSRFKYKRGF